MEKVFLTPEAFEPWFSPGDDKKTGGAREVGCADGELLLRRTEKQSGTAGAAESWWLLGETEYKELLIEALKRGKVTMKEYGELQKRAKPAVPENKKPEPKKPERKKNQEFRICRSEGVEIGLLADERPYLRVDGEEYTLSSHPYGPCTCIRKNSKIVVTIQNAFEIYGTFDALDEGGTVESVTGRRYDAPAFCAFLAAAVRAGRDELQIGDVEAYLPPEEAPEDEPQPEAFGPYETE